MTTYVILALILLCLALWGRLRHYKEENALKDLKIEEVERLREQLKRAKRKRLEAEERAALAGNYVAEGNKSAEALARSPQDGDAAAAQPVDESDVYSLAVAMEDYFNASLQPGDLLQNAYFEKGAKLFCDSSVYSPEDLIAHARGFSPVVSCMALEAMARRMDTERIVWVLPAFVNELYYWPRHYALRAIDNAAGSQSVVANLLTSLNSTWLDYVPLASLREFVARRVSLGEQVVFGDWLRGLTEEQTATLAALTNGLRGYLPQEAFDEFTRWADDRVDTEFIKTFGRVWETGAQQEEDDDSLVLLPAVEERLLEMETALRKNPPRSLLVVGESGVGKSALVRLLARKFQREGWTIFEASAAEVLAGQKYIGELEGRVQTLLKQIGGKRVLWIAQGFQQMLWAGQHQYSPTGILDLILPQMESGAIKVAGELSPVAYENLIRRRPKLRAAMQTVRVAPLNDEETLELGRRWAEMRKPSDGDAGDEFSSRISDDALREAFQLTKQYLNDKAAPGNLMLLLDSTHRRLLIERGANRGRIRLDDLLLTLSQLTGLPTQILDERAELDLAKLRGFFERRVIGQTEAVECLIERVAMIKAGLTDPTRPQGVFLFVGPTGTGKTEIAKTLAEFLFGSSERMIRLDMSELQTPESLDRILGEATDAADSTALVNSIRKQPFSVILLDEFEKAHPHAWDLFLQVFDDGRLTDRRGDVADFRHSVVIMTSNLGATLPVGASIGFSQEQAQFTSAAVERAVGRSFRREFINRIDRVVVFRPLGLSAMRDILRKELNDILNRRGLRTRQWAVEWDESAIEFLLRKGFTADLGARPLKRAVERYLLSPLAMTIVNHQFPEGDQFLFVRAGRDEKIEVEFVDPDAPETHAAAEASRLSEERSEEAKDETRELRLQMIVADARGVREEVRLLERSYEALRERVGSESWQERKTEALLQTSRPGFWDSPERFRELGLAEYMDRIETGLETAGSLLSRLAGDNSGARRADRKGFPPDLVKRVAQQLYLVEAALRGLDAGQASDAFLLVESARDAEEGEGAEFARRIASMYRGWAEKRRMRFQILEERDGKASDGYRMLAAVSGFAAYQILEPETGLHVLETPQDEKSFNRARARVRVAAQPEEPAGRAPDALLKQAERALSSDGASGGGGGGLQIVRRYREEPSPLVRDSARGWRTGKLERVLEGDFDLIF